MSYLKYLLAFVLVAIISFSCTNDNDSDNGGGNSSRQRIISKITFEDAYLDYSSEFAFKYNSDGRITRVTHTGIEDSYEESYYTRYKYNSGNDLVIESDGESAEATLNNKGYLSSVYYEDEDGSYIDEWSYTYDSNGRLISVLNEYGSYGTLWIEYTYEWSGGNIVETTTEDDEGDIYTITCSYNNKSMNIVNLDLNVIVSAYYEGIWIDIFDSPYYGDGLCGQRSKNFMTGWVYEEDGIEYQIEWKYDEEGYPVEAVVEVDDEESTYIYIEYK